MMNVCLVSVFHFWVMLCMWLFQTLFLIFDIYPVWTSYKCWQNLLRQLSFVESASNTFTSLTDIILTFQTCDMGLHSLGRVRCLPRLTQSIAKFQLSRVKRDFASRNVIKMLDSRGMLEDVFPKENVHNLGELSYNVETFSRIYHTAFQFPS